MAILVSTNLLGTYFNRTLMNQIERKNNAEVLSILQNVTDVCQLSDSLGNTLLHHAANYGNNAFIQHLIDLGAAVDAPNLQHQTPLFFAVDGGREDTALLLVEANADMFLRDVSGECPLARALQCNPHIATALLGTGTTDSITKNIEHVVSQEDRRDCGLYLFIPLKNVEITRLLLQSGSPVNAKSHLYYDTALHLAAENLDLENVKVLLEFNADVNAKRCDGETPLARVPIERDFRRSKERDEADNKALEVVKVLLAAGAVLTDSAFEKLMPRALLIFGNRTMVHTLLQGPIDLEFKDEFEETVLHVLASNKHPDILEEVPDLESASKFRSTDGYTMLHRAARSGNVSGVKHLLKSGADVNAEDSARKTPLSWALDAYWFSDEHDNTLNDYMETIEILLEHGAHPQLYAASWKFRGFRDEYDLLRKPVLAHIALLEACGRTLERFLRATIESHRACNKMFNLAKTQIAEMKLIMIGESLTLFDFMIVSDENIFIYARNKRPIANLTKVMEEHNFDSYYNRRLRIRYAKFTVLVETREILMILIDTVFNEFYNTPAYTIAEKIVNYLNDQELYKIGSFSE